MSVQVTTKVTYIRDLNEDNYQLIQNSMDVAQLNRDFGEDFDYYFIGRRDVYGSYSVWKDKRAFLVELPVNFDPNDYWEGI